MKNTGLIALLVLLASYSYGDKKEAQEIKDLSQEILQLGGFRSGCVVTDSKQCVEGLRTLRKIAAENLLADTSAIAYVNTQTNDMNAGGIISVRWDESEVGMRKHLVNQYYDLAELRSKLRLLERETQAGILCTLAEFQACKTGFDKLYSQRANLKIQGEKVVVQNAFAPRDASGFLFIDWKATNQEIVEHLAKDQ